MINSDRNICPPPVLRALLSLLLIAHAAAAAAQESDLRLPISLDADSTSYDGKSSMLMFRELKLTQGNIGVQADEGRASKLDFEDSIWQFTGNVVIDTENGRVECDSADLKFSGHQLRQATVAGSPATFETRRPGNEEITTAEARQLNYDFIAGSIEFSGDAVITEDGNKISSDVLVYDIGKQRINAQSVGSGERRVKITYTPKDDQPVSEQEPAADAAEGDQTP